ncbi:MAG: hypothetical protein QE495_01265 [Acidovorax sp.]|uniref:hypothetical protein n=1 Tax=Acidovorax sp. TaxID=1872122 RepID=UPI00262607B5|nr:hypothetical protein [Acidovorax sp.]MDH4425056.1 hypothetical protein [Acidovorax sp.]
MTTLELPRLSRESAILTDVQGRLDRLLPEMEVSDGVLEAIANLAIHRDRLAIQAFTRDAQMLSSILQAMESFPSVPAGRGKGFEARVQGVVKVVEDIQAKLEGLAQDVREVSRESAHPDVRALRGPLLDVIASLFDNMERRRWELLEQEADAAIASGRIKTFDSHADVMAFLRA